MMQYFVDNYSNLYATDDTEFQSGYERSIWKRIGRAQWRRLKREQKAKAKQLSHDLMFEQVKRLMG